MFLTCCSSRKRQVLTVLNVVLISAPTANPIAIPTGVAFQIVATHDSCFREDAIQELVSALAITTHRVEVFRFVKRFFAHRAQHCLCALLAMLHFKVLFNAISTEEVRATCEHGFAPDHMTHTEFANKLIIQFAFRPIFL